MVSTILRPLKSVGSTAKDVKYIVLLRMLDLSLQPHWATKNDIFASKASFSNNHWESIGDGAYKLMAVHLLGRIIFPNAWYIAINATRWVDWNAYRDVRGTASILVCGVSVGCGAWWYKAVSYRETGEFTVYISLGTVCLLFTRWCI